MVVRTLLLVSCLVSLPVTGEEIVRTHHLGEANAKPQKHQDVFASWLDENTLVYSANGRVVCYDLKGQREKWALEDVFPDSISVDPGSMRIGIHQSEPNMWFPPEKQAPREERFLIVDATNGKSLLRADKAQLRGLSKRNLFHPTEVAVVPNSGDLIVASFTTYFGPFARVVQKDSLIVKRSLSIDAMVRELTISPGGRYVTIVADGDVICIREVATDREVYFRGKRVLVKPKSMTGTTDIPRVSHARFDGDKTLIHTVDDSWSTGDVRVTDIKSGKSSRFDARNGYIEMDIDFKRKQIALTGTSENLTVLRFDGTEVAELKKATGARNGCVAFSPFGKRIAVGCYDRTVSVFRIAVKKQ